ncbi:AAA family ATPase [Marivirga tractuosa]|uniref:AAA family ATPase n=1 Tax=Marivirga tractuosa TaxID=1006 RepID=UPI0035D0EB8F
MFRLHNLELFGHPTLGHLNIDFRDSEVFIPDHEEPYTSVIIGMNGTGKSFILKTLADIFYQLEKMQDGEKRDTISYAFYLKYSFYQNSYEVYSNRWLTQKSTRKSISDVNKINILCNRPSDTSLFKDNIKFQPTEQYSISLDQLILPSKVIASTSQVNDRFTFKKEDDSNIYKYCGLKHTARNISSNAFKRKITNSLLDAIGYPNFKEILEATIVDFLEFDPYLTVNFRTKYTPRFYNGILEISDLEDFYIRYEEKHIRTTEPWGAWKFKQLLEQKISDPGKDSRLNIILNFINQLVKSDKLQHIRNSDSKFLKIDFFKNEAYGIDYSIINDLIQLDILYVDNIEIRKDGSDITLDQVSAGENQIIMSLLRILSNIRENSLILIDEPEISLHPNWQMKYIHLLKKMFRKFPDSHFIIATHSHFLISDLRPDSSSVISLKRENEKLIADNLHTDTYGWSAEEVLLKVFNVPTTRNYYISEKIGEILDEIAKPKNVDRLRLISLMVNQLVENNIGNLSEEDPLKEIVDKLISKYGKIG